ncbi:tryptophan--tRNA ligase [Candidatus Margulisiibacteriota bacterium]
MPQRLLSGIQPTGKMHLGNYLGAVSNWVKLQDEYESLFCIVDLHSLTTVYENPAQLRQDKLDLAIDLLACGIDPQKANLFYQSAVFEHSELHLIFSMITPLPWLYRVPTYKSKIEEIKGKDLHTYGFLGYPVLQAADIALYKADVVPVGEDQLPHLELTREIIRRFNHLYKKKVFPEAKDKLTRFPAIPGIDGRKMSKSYENTIPISSSPDQIRKLMMRMFTDPDRKLRNDPGTPEKCPVYQYHKILNSEDRQGYIADACKNAQIGCVDCKKECAEKVVDLLEPIYNKRLELEKNLDYVKNVMEKGAKKAMEIANYTMEEVRKVIGL